MNMEAALGAAAAVAVEMLCGGGGAKGRRDREGETVVGELQNSLGAFGNFGTIVIF